MTFRFCVLGAVCLGGFSAYGQSVDDGFRAIRANDLAALRTMAQKPDFLAARNNLGWTPLHYAAIYGGVESVRILLSAGANVEAAASSGATPLMFAAYNFEKTKLLVEKRANVNAHANDGKTPLMAACSAHGNAATVRYLLDKGADVKAETERGVDALSIAASNSETEVVNLLLEKGADTHHVDKANFNALANSLQMGDRERVGRLIAAGSDVNAVNSFSGTVKNGPIAMAQMSPLSWAAPGADPSVIGALLRAKARPDNLDCRKMTPLMLVVASEKANPESVRQLIDAGADVNAKDQNGESVLDWALKHQQPAIVKSLKDAGAKPAISKPAPVRPADFVSLAPAEAARRASDLLARSSEVFFERSGCVGCHHQPLAARAYAAMRAANLQPDERMKKVLLDDMVAFRPILSGLPLLEGPPGDFDQVLGVGPALIALGEPANSLTDSAIHFLAVRQEMNGSWNIRDISRPPLETNSICTTSVAIRCLRAYSWPARAEEFEARIALARKWLESAKPVNSHEHAERLTGLKAAGVSEAFLRKAGDVLQKMQRADGGWNSNPYLESDAYSTGIVLRSLYDANLLKPTDESYRRGVAYLLKTQFPDGSWYVRSRSVKFQPYFQSGFPFDHDQWISAAGTAWAVMALAPAAAN